MILKNMNMNHLQVEAGHGLGQITGIGDPKPARLIIRDPDQVVEVSTHCHLQIYLIENIEVVNYVALNYLFKVLAPWK